MELHDFAENKYCFVAYDMLFLEKSLGTHFCQFKCTSHGTLIVWLCDVIDTDSI
jgi:hypothetical protein